MPEKSWVFCEHANECPSVCPCGPDCICRDGMCKVDGPTHTFQDWASFQQAIRNHIAHHGMQSAFTPMARTDLTIQCQVCKEFLVFNVIGLINEMMHPTDPELEPAEHHRHTSLLDLFESARHHVEVRLNHKVRVMDDTYNKMFGFVCEGCNSTFMIHVDDYRTWLSESCSAEARRLFSIFLYRRYYLYGLMNSAGDFLKNVDPLSPMESCESAQTAYQRLMMEEET